MRSRKVRGESLKALYGPQGIADSAEMQCPIAVVTLEAVRERSSICAA
jgi:hypothetical protein